MARRNGSYELSIHYVQHDKDVRGDFIADVPCSVRLWRKKSVVKWLEAHCDIAELLDFKGLYWVDLYKEGRVTELDHWIILGLDFSALYLDDVQPSP